MLTYEIHTRRLLVKTKTKVTICAILLVVLALSALAVVIHQIAIRPEPITRDQFEMALNDDLYKSVYLKGNKVTAIDHEGNRFGFEVEDPYEFEEYVTDSIMHLELQTGYSSNLKPQPEE